MLYFFFFNDTATTEIYTLSLHDALPIWSWLRVESGLRTMEFRAHRSRSRWLAVCLCGIFLEFEVWTLEFPDRKSTRLNSSHLVISYAVFCLKKKKTSSGSVSTST